MRETQFIEQNKEKWTSFEEALEGNQQDPERLNDLFIQITDDLSYARTFYPYRSVRVYLNGVAQRVYTRIYGSRRVSAGRLQSFWTEELPSLMYASRGKLWLSFAAFVLSVSIGMLSSAMDPAFVEVILGEGYVSMTKENIAAGDPMAVYKDQGRLGMSIGITANNLFVTLLIFVMGAFFGVGALVIIISNGIMVGAFQYFFIQEGLFWESFLTIWIHGTLEMSAMVIAGAAGITMGHGFVFPGTYTRMQAFQRSARQGLKILAGIAPIVVLAGIIEGYLTRHTDTPDLVRGVFILSCLAFVLLYFVWYPAILARVGRLVPLGGSRTPPDRSEGVSFDEVKSAGRVFSETFLLGRHFGGRFAGMSFGLAVVYVLLAFGLSSLSPEVLFRYDETIFPSLMGAAQLYSAEGHLPYVALLLLAVLAYSTMSAIAGAEAPGRPPRSAQQVLLLFLYSVVCVVLFMAPLLLGGWYVLLLLASGSFGLLWLYVCFREGLPLPAAFMRTATLVGTLTNRTASAFALMLFFCLVFMMLSDTFVVSFFFQLIAWVVDLNDENVQRISIIATTVWVVGLLNVVFTLLVANMSLWYYSLLEATDAPALRQKIQAIRLRREIRGLEREG